MLIPHQPSAVPGAIPERTVHPPAPTLAGLARSALLRLVVFTPGGTPQTTVAGRTVWLGPDGKPWRENKS